MFQYFNIMFFLHEATYRAPPKEKQHNMMLPLLHGRTGMVFPGLPSVCCRYNKCVNCNMTFYVAFGIMAFLPMLVQKLFYCWKWQFLARFSLTFMSSTVSVLRFIRTSCTLSWAIPEVFKLAYNSFSVDGTLHFLDESNLRRSTVLSLLLSPSHI